MSQFIVVEHRVPTHGLERVVQRPLPEVGDFVRDVAGHYFAEVRDCQLVTYAAGAGEPLVDDVCDAMTAGARIEDTEFMRFLSLLVGAGVGFVCWHGADYSTLPLVHTWAAVVEEVRKQARLQPADLWLAFTASK